MRLCRVTTSQQPEPQVAYYFDDSVVPLSRAFDEFARASGQSLSAPQNGNLLPLLGPEGPWRSAANQVWQWLTSLPADARNRLAESAEQVEFQLPIPRPNKLFLLAGNYAAHVEEGGELAKERRETFPYVFMKPPSTTLMPHRSRVPLPQGWEDGVDYELELAVVIGRRGRRIPESQALDYVAGYTVINDLSHRTFRPNPQRVQRPRDAFFDWLHGKWFDGFCPCGPCVLSAAVVPDPQRLDMELRVNGQVRQQASTAQQIFPVAAVISFISQIVTLEPGDLISTGTPAGVGHAQGVFLQPGDEIHARIDPIGTLQTTITEPA